MRVASKVIVLVRDPDGFGIALADALRPAPESHLTRESSPFEISLAKYGITDTSASGDLIHFVDPRGSPQVSILVLPNYAPPVAACAINEIVGSITWANFSHLPVLILPLITKTLNADHEVAHRAKSAEAITIYGAQIGDANNSADTLVSGLAVPPPSFQIRSEPLACLVQVVRVSKLPTVLLMAPSSEQQSKGSADRELEALYEIGNFLASRANLSFSKESIQDRKLEKSRGAQEPWRELYG
uniref:DUF7894 domain-containing protein n=1 Tax=Ananas comosus var. bracteatus TaxID=296719 RepID=A0A6V7P3B6_ANACO|nr:unnamed protein product [Ananas comosus var. bracteatus]